MRTDTDYRKLLEDLVAELKAARSSLAGRPSAGPADVYIFHCASQITALADGYLCLRRVPMWHASRHLIRPAIESVFRIHAVRSSPGTFYRIAFTELQEDKKLARSGPPEESGKVLKQLDARWAEFQKEYARVHPQHGQKDATLSYWELAKIGGLESYYSTHYRFYSQFTHGALRATSGTLDEFQFEDDPTMALCALACVDALVSIGATAPSFETLKKRFPTNDRTKA